MPTSTSASSSLSQMSLEQLNQTIDLVKLRRDEIKKDKSLGIPAGAKMPKDEIIEKMNNLIKTYEEEKGKRLSK